MFDPANCNQESQRQFNSPEGVQHDTITPALLVDTFLLPFEM